MVLDREQIRSNAKAALSANYWPLVAWTGILVGISLVCGFIPYLGYLGAIIAVPVMSFSILYSSYLVYAGKKLPEPADCFVGFNDFGRVLGGYWYMNLFVWLWSLLFVIPGIIKYYSYCLMPYILMDRPDLSVDDAMKESIKMTEGHKMDIFVLQLSFIGWFILTELTGGLLGIFYVVPYYQLAMAGVYESLKGADYVNVSFETDIPPVMDEAEKRAQFYDGTASKEDVYTANSFGTPLAPESSAPVAEEPVAAESTVESTVESTTEAEDNIETPTEEIPQ